ncbi:chemotaxis protein CheW [Gemmatimonas sp.]|jgi:two-component system chemotaxis sensor kinase CheA|uniref:chemotaxis protein CheW n=1 Tax=Gemmatimonas sp. TaxID=1962908 RepID=UPI003DA31603
MDAAHYAALFQAEAREHLAELDAALLALEEALRHAADVDATSGHVTTLFRAMHTIKGMAGSMGYTTIEKLSHAVESRCEPLRSGDEPVSAGLLVLLFESTDRLRGAIDDIARGVETPPAVIGSLLVRLRRPVAAAESALPYSAPRASADVVVASADPFPDVANVRHVDVRLVSDCPLKGVRATIVVARLAKHGEVRATHPEQARWQDDQFDGVFRITLVSDAVEETLVQAAMAAGDVARVQVRTPAFASQLVRQAAAAAPAPDATRTVRIDARRLDTLLDLVGELVITRDRLLRALEAQEHPDRDVQRAARDAARLVSAMQDEVLQSRLMPVGQLFDRFPRLVRDVTRELGKDVSFVMEGREIELDRSLLDAIGDPLLHLLRNALDHGLEEAAAREAAGKSPRGELILRAARDRAAVIIQVQDDGRGIHRETVLKRAKEQGLVADDVAELSDDTLLQVIAHPGFSTARRVTNLSGRGVGVDVVNTRVRALGGQLELESIEGVGTVVTLRLPVTLAITRALLVEVCGSTFAIPTTHVEEALEYHESLTVHHTTGPAVTIRDEVVSLVALGERFRLLRSSTNASTRAHTAGSGGEQHLAIVEAGGRRVALLVDALVAQQDIVVKPLDVVRGAAPWFSGATVLGDGSPALIIDVPSVV